MTTRPAMLLTALLASLAISACGSADDAESESAAFSVAGEQLTIAKKSGGDIDLRPGDVDKVEVTRWFTGDPDEATWDLEDDELTLDTECGFLSSCDVRYRVTVPRELAVVVKASNGDVTAAGFESALSIRTENGDIRVSGASGDLRLKSTSGDQRATGLTSRDVQARAENGRIRLTFSASPDHLSVATQNGAVTARVPDDSYTVTISTENGSVNSKLTTSRTSAKKIGVTTENGDVHLRTN